MSCCLSKVVTVGFMAATVSRSRLIIQLNKGETDCGSGCGCDVNHELLRVRLLHNFVTRASRGRYFV